MSLPVERSITVSAPKWTAVCSFSSSPSMLLVTAELPMLALIFVFAAMPMPIGSSRFCRCTLLAGMTIRPRATSLRTNSGSRPSRLATNSISGVTSPSRADSIWVMVHSIRRIRLAEKIDTNSSYRCRIACQFYGATSVGNARR